MMESSSNSVRILFIPSGLHTIGGTGYVDSYAIKAMAELGYQVLVVNSKPIHPNYAKFLSKSNVKMINLSDRRVKGGYLKLPGFRMDFHVSKTFPYILKTYRPRIVWFMGSLPSKQALEAKRFGARVIVYYHMIAPWYYEIRGYYRKYTWRDLSILWFTWMRILGERRTFDLNPFDVADAVVVNSKYMQLLGKKYWGLTPWILNPPVDVESYAPYVKPRSERLKQVISLGRISPEKRYEMLIEAVSFTITKPKIILAGALTPKNVEYLRQLLSTAKRYGVNLVVHVNISEDLKRELLSQSMVYIHSAVAEHFGITVIEAMATGLPVIVHRSGEPYWGIIDRGRYGLSYQSVEELAEAIDTLISSEETWLKYSDGSLQRARDFNYIEFKKRVREILENSSQARICGNVMF